MTTQLPEDEALEGATGGHELNGPRVRIAELRQRARGARRRLPDITGAVGGWWDRRPRWQRWVAIVAVLVLAVLAPANSVGRIMAPSRDWKTILFNPIG